LILLGCSNVSTEIVKAIYKHKNKPFKKISSFFFLLTAHPSLPSGPQRRLAENDPRRRSSSNDQLAIFCAKGFFQPR